MGFDQFLTTNISVRTQEEFDTLEIDYINEADEEVRRVKKGELRKLKQERKRSVAAAAMLTSSVRSKDLKLLAKFKLNPKKIFDAIYKKYGSEEDSDVTDLLEEFKDCNLKNKRKDPEGWSGRLDESNGLLEEIDPGFKKNEKELAAHILANLPKGYGTIRKIIKMDDKYLDDLSKIKSRISKHWKNSFWKKRKTQQSDSDESASSDSSSSDKSDRNDKSKNKMKDKYALTVDEEKEDSVNSYGILVCGHCNKLGHGIANC